jgi:hypothetical protein
MRVYFGFNLQTHALICHEMAKHIAKQIPDSRFAGVMTVKDGLHEKILRGQDEIPYEFLDTTDAIEKKALDYDASDERIAEWERRLKRPLMDLVVADRNIGHRYVHGGTLVKTDIMAFDSHEYLKKFVCCFLDTYEEQLKKFRPDVVFFPVIASLPGLALARVCQFLNIPFVVLRSTRIGNRFIMSHNDDTDRFHGIEAAFEDACKRGSSLTDLSEEFQSYLESFQSKLPEKPEWLISCNQSIERLQTRNFFLFYGELAARFALACKRKLFPRRNRELRWKHPFSIIHYQFSQWMAVRYFSPKQFEMPRDDEPFVYFPLHLNPEAATMVRAPGFVDQAAVIDLLAKNIPLSHKLYVKEHPKMIGRRPKGFYARLCRNVNVRLINPLADSMELSRRADLVAVITGTAGWEAVLMGRPVLTLGESFFSHLGFSHPCSDVEQIGPLIKEIVFNGLTPRRGRDDLVRWMDCLYMGSFDLPDGIQVLWSPLTPHFLTDTQRNVARVLAEHLIKVGGEETSDE